MVFYSFQFSKWYFIVLSFLNELLTFKTTHLIKSLELSKYNFVPVGFWLTDDTVIMLHSKVLILREKEKKQGSPKDGYILCFF